MHREPVRSTIIKGIDQIFPPMGPTWKMDRITIPIGTPGRWNDASIRSRSEAPWGPPLRSAYLISVLGQTGGVNPQKGTHRREVLSTLPAPGICVARFDGYSGSRRARSLLW